MELQTEKKMCKVYFRASMARASTAQPIGQYVAFVQQAKTPNKDNNTRSCGRLLTRKEEKSLSLHIVSNLEYLIEEGLE